MRNVPTFSLIKKQKEKDPDKKFRIFGLHSV